MGRAAKKLKEAAIWLCSAPQPRVDQAARDEAEKGLGIRPAATNAASDADSDPGFTAWPDNEDAVRVFDGMKTQWRAAAGLSVMYLGLDYGVLPIVLTQLGFKEPAPKGIFQALRIMECAARDHLNGVKQ
ncbi:DUF1799 domain-containing protein [Burkholderiaceae bacterium UC74_6]